MSVSGQHPAQDTGGQSPSGAQLLLQPGKPGACLSQDLGDCPLLQRGLPRLVRPLPSAPILPRPPGAPACGSKAPAGGGAVRRRLRVRPAPRAPRTPRGERGGAGRAGHGLPGRGPLRGGGSVSPQELCERRSCSRVPAASRRSRPRSRPRTPAATGSPPGRSAARGPPARTARSPRGAARTAPGPASRPRLARVYGSVPPRAAPRGHGARPGRDSWAPKGLSRRRGGPSAPHAAGAPGAAPARRRPPARYLRPRPRSSSTWRLSPGAAPQPAPRLGAAHPAGCSDTAGGGGALGNYHILAYQCVSRGFPSQWSLWRGGAWSGHAQVLLRA